DSNQNSATFTQTNSPYDILDASYDIGPSNFDVRHKIVASAVWRPTFYRGDRRSLGNYLLNGWSTSPIGTYFSGAPFTPSVSATSSRWPAEIRCGCRAGRTWMYGFRSVSN